MKKLIKILKVIEKIILWPFKWIYFVIEKAAERPIIVGILLLILIGYFVINTSINRGKSYEGPFLDSVLVEAHGLLFDIFVFAILIVFFNKLGEKKRDIKRYKEEIDDYRGWDEKEAVFRIVGNIRRLNKLKDPQIDLSKCYLNQADLSGADLKKSKLKEANLWGASFILADLSGADLIQATLRGANLNKANLIHADLSRANLIHADLSEANLSGARLSRAHLSGADLSGADLSRAKLSEAKLVQTKLVHAKLSFADLSRTDLSRADLSGAKLVQTKLVNANLLFADLSGAYLSSANFKAARLNSIRGQTLYQLSEVKTLYEAELDPELLEQVKEKYPHLLMDPAKEDVG